MDIRKHIEDRIKAAGMTKKEFAAKMGAHAGSLNSLINKPSWPTLENIAKAFGIEVEQLFVSEPTNELACPHCGKPIHIRLEP